MKKTILFVLLLLFGCNNTEPQNSVNPPEDTTSPTALLTKEKADTIMYNFLVDELDCDTIYIPDHFELVRIDTVYKKGDSIAVLRNIETDSCQTIILKEDSWVYYSNRFTGDCRSNEGFTIINAYTGEITPKIEGYGCSSWYITEDFTYISPFIPPKAPVIDKIDILASRRTIFQVDGNIENNGFYEDK